MVAKTAQNWLRDVAARGDSAAFLSAGGFEIRSKFRRRRIPDRPMLNPAANTFTGGGVGDTLRIRVLGLAIADPAHLYL